MDKQALVIGAGLGGLSTALRLVRDGYQVSIIDMFHQPGGRLNQLKKDGFTFDMAPTFFSMSYEFDALAAYCNIKRPFEWIPLDPLYQVNFRGNDQFYTIYKDISRLHEQFHNVEPDFALKLRRYLDSSGKLFHDIERTIIKKNHYSLAGYLASMAKLPPKHIPKLIRTMWSDMNRHFSSYEAKVIFSLVAFFLGNTPFDTSSIYSILTYTELVHDGYHNVKGGMYKIVEGLVEELKKKNVSIKSSVRITNYVEEHGKIKAFIDDKGTRHEADLFVVNADAASFRGQVMGRKKYNEKNLQRMQWTLAPYTMYLGVKGKINALDHHNYFLGNDFKTYSAGIFKNKVKLDKPYYYVNVPSRFNEGHAPEGSEAVFVLCPVPDLRFKPCWDDREILGDTIIQDLSSRTGYDIDKNIVSKTIYDPSHWGSMMGLYKGNGLGLAHNIRQVGYFRPKNKDEVYNNLFYVGSSTVPGTGLPMALISSELVTKRINETFGVIHEE